MTTPKVKVLFLCTGNSARSQMAEALLNLDAGGRFEAYSAGTDPKGVHACSIRAMAELGSDISKARSKHVSEFANDRSSGKYTDRIDYVISVCDRARESCPVWPGGARRIAWSFDDPAAASGNEELQMQTFRRVRDEIRAEILKFIKSVE